MKKLKTCLMLLLIAKGEYNKIELLKETKQAIYSQLVGDNQYFYLESVGDNLYFYLESVGDNQYFYLE